MCKCVYVPVCASAHADVCASKRRPEDNFKCRYLCVIYILFSLLRQHHSLTLNSTNMSESLRNLLVYTSKHWSSNHIPSSPEFYMWVLVVKLKSLCLYGKHRYLPSHTVNIFLNSMDGPFRIYSRQGNNIPRDKTETRFSPI